LWFVYTQRSAAIFIAFLAISSAVRSELSSIALAAADKKLISLELTLGVETA
jgi:hypothetical protein